jgi:nucleotide-binding universal stress UspA family protein
MPKTFDTIICAVDLSDRSERALGRAMALASSLGARLECLHVVDREQPAQLQTRQRQIAQEHLDALVARLGQRSPSAAIEVTIDDPVDAIGRRAAGRDGSLLVLGAPRRYGRRWPFSSHTAGRMLRTARVPVLVAVRPGNQPWQRVLTAVDWSLHSRRAVAAALAIAPEARHRLLHAWQVPYEDLQPGERPRQEYAQLSQLEMQRFLDQDLAPILAEARARTAGFQVETAHRMGEAQVAIRDEAAAESPDLVVLGTRGGSALRRAVLGSVAEDILSDPPADVLVAVGG